MGDYVKDATEYPKWHVSQSRFMGLLMGWNNDITILGVTLPKLFFLPLWSADNLTCLVKISRNQFGDCFATADVAVPTLLYSLLEQLWQQNITFRQCD